MRPSSVVFERINPLSFLWQVVESPPTLSYSPQIRSICIYPKSTTSRYYRFKIAGLLMIWALLIFVLLRSVPTRLCCSRSPEVEFGS